MYDGAMLQMKGCVPAWSFSKRHAVLLSSAKWRHNCDPPPILGEHDSNRGCSKSSKLKCRVGLLEDQENP